MNLRIILATAIFSCTLVGCASDDDILATSGSSSVAASGSSFDYGSASGDCDADAVQGVVGQKASKDLVDRARRQAGAATVRALGPNDVFTTEYNHQRLNLRLDESGAVVSVNCG